MPNAVVWFDIPVLDLDRAIKFYSVVMGAPVRKQEFPGGAIGLLPHGEQDIGGCLYESDDNRPSEHGALLYLNVSGRLDAAIATVEPGGGRIIQPRHAVGPYGFRAIILDSEGNRIALHST